MKALLKKLVNIITHFQVLVVFLAFIIMVVLSYRFMSNIERSHLLRDVNDAYINTQMAIEADLKEPETTLGVVAENVRNLLVQGFDADGIYRYLKNMSVYVTSEKHFMSYAVGFYGAFDVFDGHFISGIDWDPPEDFIQESRPWYISAVEANGEVGITEPYINMITNVMTLTFSRRIFDDEGNALGIVALDIMLDRIKEYAVNTYITKGSYGILLDKNFDVIAHPLPSFIGRNVVLMNDGEAIRDLILREEIISERIAHDYNGDECVLFVRPLNNGWYLAILAYSKDYYQNVTRLARLLIFMGFFLAAVVSAILVSVAMARKKAEERTQMMLDATPLSITLWDKKIQLIDFNYEAVRIVGAKTKKEYREIFISLVPEYQVDGRKSIEKFISFIRNVFDKGYGRMDWNYNSISGERIPFDVTAVRLQYKENPVVMMCSRDVRELNSAIAKIREADECSQVLFNATPLSCLMIDKRNNIIECNEETLRLFGLSEKAEFINQFTQLSPEYQPNGEASIAAMYRNIDEAFEEGFCRFEWMHIKSDGEQLPVEVTLVRVKFRGEYAVACYARDLREFKAMIAEMHRAEIAEESNKAKSDFLAKMSHEIRTPMNAILGIAEIQLQDNSLPAVTKEALARIYNSGELLLGIINDILDLSKIEAGKLELTEAQYDVASLIYDVVQLNIMRYESKPIEFKLDVAHTVPSILIGDELRIKQILNNILSNAFKYTHEGAINMSVSVGPLTHDRSENSVINLIICVKDTGQGMTKEQVARLGDMYSRFNIDINRTTEGTGLGMNITKMLINMMKGNMTIESAPGIGSVFTVYLPQGDAGFDAFGKEWAENLGQLNIKNSNTKKRNTYITREFMPYGRVLVVDDVETNLYVAKGLLASYGLSIDTALSGFETIDKIKSGSVYDIIFMDHMMPKMDGIEAVRILREMGYKRPVIALTANALAGQAEMFMKNGFDGFISKPIDIRQLNSVLNKMIRDKQSADVLEAARRQKSEIDESQKDKSILNQHLAEIFIRDAEKAYSIINAIYKNNCRRADDISMLIINTHAIKSALANIGENDLCESAAKLEQAGRENNTAYIMAQVPVFLQELRRIITGYRENSETANADEYIETEETRSFLRESLFIIQAACARYDKKSAKDTLTELRDKTWPPNIKERLNTMSEHLLHSEFEEVASIAQELMPG